MKLKAFGSAKRATRAPWVPGVLEITRLATDQHSSADSLLALPVIVVTLSGWGGGGGLREESEVGAAVQRRGRMDAKRSTVEEIMMNTNMRMSHLSCGFSRCSCDGFSISRGMFADFSIDPLD